MEGCQQKQHPCGNSHLGIRNTTALQQAARWLWGFGGSPLHDIFGALVWPRYPGIHCGSLNDEAGSWEVLPEPIWLQCIEY